MLILSAYGHREYVMGLLNAGALGYVHKGDSPHMLLNAIRAVAGGSKWISPTVAGVLLDSVRKRQEKESDTALTPRQLEVLQAMARGLTNDQIADELFIAEQTVKNHIRNILRKLGVETRVEAVLYALRHDLASLEDSKELVRE